MTNSPSTPSTHKIDFKSIDLTRINQVLTTGSISMLSPAEQKYYELMDLVRGLRLRQLTPEGKPITKAGIIKLLRNQYGVSDWTARQVFNDAINFFYAVDNVTPKAWANLYAERLDKLADAAIAIGNIKLAVSIMEKAAHLRGADKAAELDAEAADELPPPSTVIYTTKASDLGLPETDEAEIIKIIDSVPNIPQVVRENLKEDAGVAKMDLKRRLLYDQKNFGDQEGS